MIFFIFPYFRVGGADKVHLEIIKSVNQGKRVFVLFSSTDGSEISNEFRKNAKCFLVHTWLRKILCAVLLFFLSHLNRITVFGCNSIFFYLLLPILSKRSKKIDLTHAFSFPDWGIENLAVKYVKYINQRIVINQTTLIDYKNQYQRLGIDSIYLNRFQIIPNGIGIKKINLIKLKERFNDFKIGYVGRFSQEKRPELFLSIALELSKSGIKAKMIVDEFKLAKSNYDMIEIIEGISDKEIIRTEFSEISVLILPSLREGFPLAIMEAMELGIPVISTAVGSIAEHIQNGENGYISSGIESINFQKFCLEKVKLLQNSEELYEKISLSARQYAIAKFDIKNFRHSYKKLFVNV